MAAEKVQQASCWLFKGDCRWSSCKGDYMWGFFEGDVDVDVEEAVDVDVGVLAV